MTARYFFSEADGSLVAIPEEPDKLDLVELGWVEDMPPEGSVGARITRTGPGQFTVDWDAFDADLVQQVASAASAARTLYIGDAAQRATYIHKEEQARAWTAEADPADFPRLTSEAQLRGITIGEMAALIIEAADDGWRVDGLIELARIGAQEAVTAATTAEAKRDAAAVDWDAVVSGGE